MGIPQVILVVICAIEVYKGLNDSKEKFWNAVLGNAILHAILFWGGWYSK